MLPSRSSVAVLTLVVCVLLAMLPLHAQRQRTRLLVLNRTGTVIQLEQQEGNSWETRSRIKPGATHPVYNVTNGDRFRVRWRGGKEPSEHTVKLEYDRSYGGYQDQWTVTAQ
jgi:hypothetical protein